MIIFLLVLIEYIPGVDLFGDVGEVGGGSVGEDSVGEALEFGEVVDHTAAEECGAVLEGGLVDDHGGPLGLDAFHHALDR